MEAMRAIRDPAPPPPDPLRFVTGPRRAPPHIRPAQVRSWPPASEDGAPQKGPHKRSHRFSVLEIFVEDVELALLQPLQVRLADDLMTGDGGISTPAGPQGLLWGARQGGGRGGLGGIW